MEFLQHFTDRYLSKFSLETSCCSIANPLDFIVEASKDEDDYVDDKPHNINSRKNCHVDERTISMTTTTISADSFEDSLERYQPIDAGDFLTAWKTAAASRDDDEDRDEQQANDDCCGPNSLGSLYNERGNMQVRDGKLKMAAISYRQAIAVGDKYHQVSAYMNLATLYWKQGLVQEATSFLQKAWDIHESMTPLTTTTSDRTTKEASLTSANSLYKLGLCSGTANDFNTALRRLERAHEIRSRVFGEEHLSVGQTMEAMGRVHMMQGDWMMALACHKNALSIFRAVHAPTLHTYQSIADIYIRGQCYEEATAALHEVIRILRIEYSLSVSGGGNDTLGPASSSPQSTNHSKQCLELIASIRQTLKKLEELYTEMGQDLDAELCRRELASTHM